MAALCTVCGILAWRRGESLSNQDWREHMEQQTGTLRQKGLAQMLKGGVIMDVVTPEHAKIRRAAGACRGYGAGTSPGGYPRQGAWRACRTRTFILRIMDTVTIRSMAKCRIGHFVEAQIWKPSGRLHR